MTSAQGEFRVQRRVVGLHWPRWIFALSVTLTLAGVAYFVAFGLDRKVGRAVIIDREVGSNFLEAFDDPASALNCSSRAGNESSRAEGDQLESKLYPPVPADVMPPFLEYLGSDDPDFSELERGA